MYDEKDLKRIEERIASGDNEQRRHVELQRFQSITGFVEAQTCRRQVVLNYFAEYTEKGCGNCDICLDPPSLFNGLEVAQKVLSCVYRIEQQGDSEHVVNVLRGQRTDKIVQLSHDKVSTFAIGSDKTPGFWHAIIRQLIHLGFLQQEIANHSTLCLTQAAHAILKGEVALMLASPRLQKASYWRQGAQRTSYDRKLFAKLRTLRKTIADAEDIAPYIVFNDATLSELAKFQPTNDIEMLQISGIGDTKLQRYGAPFLALIKEHLHQS